MKVRTVNILKNKIEKVYENLKEFKNDTILKSKLDILQIDISTGVMDANGEEIFENDILEIENETWRVEYVTGTSFVCVKKDSEDCMLFLYAIQKFKVYRKGFVTLC